MADRYVAVVEDGELHISEHGINVAGWPLATPADADTACRVLGFLIDEAVRGGMLEWGQVCEDAARLAIAALSSLDEVA